MRAALLAAAVLLSTPAVSADKAPEGDLKAQVDQWHRERISRLKAEDGWLSLVGLHWLEEGGNAAGSKKGAPVALPESAPGDLGVFTRKGDEVTFTPAKGAKVTLDGRPFQGGAVKTDAQGAPDVLQSGTLRLMVIARGDRLGVRVKDAAAKTRTGFHGIDRFPVSTAWVKQARWEPADGKATLAIPNVLGQVSEEPLAGTAVFTHDRVEHRLVATKAGDDLFFVFGDLTNRKETYGAGRFLYAPAPQGGKVTLDFNRAYNPPCAFTPYATCPLPPKGNRLKVRVEAGEKRYGDH